MPNVETILREHVTLNVDCIDRLYLNGYVPRLQRPENLWWFLHEHRGNPVVSPVLLKHMVDSFVASIREFAERQAIPIVHFERGQRKEEIARRYLARFKGREGVVLIGVAQEMVASFRVYQKGPRRRQRTPRGGRAPCFSFYRGQLDVNQISITSIFSTATSASAPSSSPPTLLSASASGSTATNGRSASSAAKVSATRSCRTASSNATTRSLCKRSATPSALRTSILSSAAGCAACRILSPPPIAVLECDVSFPFSKWR